MTAVILSAATARADLEDIDHCTCPIHEPCTCGGEAPLRRVTYVGTGAAGWVVTR